jgi:hypothetical protein
MAEAGALGQFMASPGIVPAAGRRWCAVALAEASAAIARLDQTRDRPKGGGSGRSAERTSGPALSDSMVLIEGAVR